MNNQHRYLIGLPRGEDRVFLTWRLLPEDSPHTGFHVERRQKGVATWQRLTTQPISNSTNYLDQPMESALYEYRVLTEEGGRCSKPLLSTHNPLPL